MGARQRKRKSLRMAPDLFRNPYTLNYEALAGSPRTEPSLSQWRPSLDSEVPAAALRIARNACAAASGVA